VLSEPGKGGGEVRGGSGAGAELIFGGDGSIRYDGGTVSIEGVDGLLEMGPGTLCGKAQGGEQGVVVDELREEQLAEADAVVAMEVGEGSHAVKVPEAFRADGQGHAYEAGVVAGHTGGLVSERTPVVA
jgi:hypothetical protein